MVETKMLFLFLILLVLLGCSAFFSGSETALMAITRLRLKLLAETKPRRVAMVEKVLKHPEKLIGAILLGNNLVNVAMSAIATMLAISVWGEKGIVYVTAILTVTILIFAEITPKVYAKYFNERVSMITAPILNVIMWIANPAVVAVTYVSRKLLLLIGLDMKTVEKPLMSEAEIHACINMGWDEGAITGREKKMLDNVFTLNDKTVGEIMIPESRMKALDIKAPLKEAIKTVLETGFTRFPVRGEDSGQIIGFIHAKDLFELLENDPSTSLIKIVRPPEFVSMDAKIDRLLRRFKLRKVHLAVVMDDTGNVAGLVTLEDILEELVGSIKDEHDE
jgi:magnesium and cobalt exporter, CNNM family